MGQRPMSAPIIRDAVSASEREGDLGRGACVAGCVKAVPGLEHVRVDSDVQLLRRLVARVGHDARRAPRWVHVQEYLHYGSGVCQEICVVLGYDPHALVGLTTVEALTALGLNPAEILELGEPYPAEEVAETRTCNSNGRGALQATP